MEEGDLKAPLVHGGGGEVRWRWKEVVVEVKKQLWLAGPLIVVSLFQYCLQVVSVMYVGHLGELQLSGAAMATSFAGVTGFSLLLGMASALDTFCGQAYGAKQYHMLGVHKQRAMFILTIVSIPLAIIWFNTSQILLFLGQDPEISQEAGHYARWMIPSIFAYGLLQCHVRFLQTQNIVFPMVFCTGITALLHLLVCWILVFKSGLGSRGAALANAISYWTNLVLLGAFVRISPDCKRSWLGFSWEALKLNDMISFLRLSVPSAVMVCLEFWSFEFLVLASGLLPNPQLETSVLSICLNTASMVFMIPFGLGGAISTRVSNELGAGRPMMARLAVVVVVAMSIIEGLILATLMMATRNFWGYSFSNEEEVVKAIANMMPILATSSIFDGIQCVLSGAARGCGWQKIGAIVNLGAYYIVGIPLAILFAFVFDMGGRGLWTGIICGLVAQSLLLSIVTIRTDWRKEVENAKDRVYEHITVE